MKRLFPTCLLILSILAIFFVSAFIYQDKIKQTGIAQLEQYVKDVASIIHDQFEADRAYLERAALQIADYDLATEREQITQLFAVLNGTRTISRLELLLPGDQLLTEDGTVMDVSGQLSFEAEATQEFHISSRSADLFDTQRQVVREFVPVVKDGKAVAVLTGVVGTDDMKQLFHRHSDQFELFLLKQSGEFIIDSLHNQLLTKQDFWNRPLQQGYDQSSIIADFASGQANYSVVYSESYQDYLYIYYMPLAIEDWIVLLTMPQRTVLGSLNLFLSLFGVAGGLLLLVCIVYFGWILRDVLQQRDMSRTVLGRTQYILDVENKLFNVHIRPSCVIEALQVIADYMTGETAFFYITDISIDLPDRFWSYGKPLPFDSHENFREQFPGITQTVYREGSFICFDVSTLRTSCPTDWKSLAACGTENLMLLPITQLNGSIVGILGVYNMKFHWRDIQPLQQIALSFSMALDHFKAYQHIIAEGQTDSLTGLGNRMAYDKAIDSFSMDGHHAAACVYIDLNGLHERNNMLGHKAGDHMLQTVASALQDAFPDSGVFRIGGDEFVVLCQDVGQRTVVERISAIRARLARYDYELSAGIQYETGEADIHGLISGAEAAMQEDKRIFYKNKGLDHQMRVLNRQLEKLLQEKKDSETFLRLLAPKYPGIFFINLVQSRARTLMVQPIFSDILKRSNQDIKEAFRLYARDYIHEDYRASFLHMCDFTVLAQQLKGEQTVRFDYQRSDQTWIRLTILNAQPEQQEHETLWIFKQICSYRCPNSILCKGNGNGLCEY